MKYSINILTAILIAMSFIFVSCSSDKDEPEYIANELIGFWQSDPFHFNGEDVVIFFEFNADKTYKMAIFKNKNQPVDSYKNDQPMSYEDGSYSIQDGLLYTRGTPWGTIRVKGDRFAIYNTFEVFVDEQPIFNSYYAFTRIKDSEEEEPFEPQTFTANGLTYVSEDGKTATLTYTDDSDSYGHNYSDLTSAQIPSTVTYNNRTFTVTAIGDNAFRKCTSLSNVVIPSTVKEIGELAFYSCTALKSITIPESVEKLGRGVFGSCTQLQHITVHSNNPIFDSRNNCNAIIETATNTLVFGSNSTVIPSSVTAIGNDAFSGYNQLTSIAIPGSVTSIGNGAFYSCRGLSQIQLPNSVVSIGNNAFKLCTGLTDVSIPQSVTSIGKGAFSSCTKIETLSIGKNVKTIEDEAFSGCKNLNTVTNYATTPQSISENVFSNKGTLKVPEASLSKYKETPVWKAFKSIVKI